MNELGIILQLTSITSITLIVMPKVFHEFLIHNNVSFYRKLLFICIGVNFLHDLIAVGIFAGLYLMNTQSQVINFLSAILGVKLFFTSICLFLIYNHDTKTT